jgi:dTDP-4-dehydrorhamnose reductase
LSRPVLVVGRSGQLALSLAERAAFRGVELVFAGRPALDLGDPDGPDMNERYKETGQGGLAVNVVEC